MLVDIKIRFNFCRSRSTVPLNIFMPMATNYFLINCKLETRLISFSYTLGDFLSTLWTSSTGVFVGHVIEEMVVSFIEFNDYFVGVTYPGNVFFHFLLEGCCVC